MTNSEKFAIKNVRISFPSLFKKAVFNGVEKNFEATFLILKESTEDSENRKLLLDGIKALENLNNIKLEDNQKCLYDGDKPNPYTGIVNKNYEGYYVFKASNKDKVDVLNTNGTDMSPESDLIVGGCYVDALVSFWFQKGAFGKRINANLHAVRYVNEGEPFITKEDYKSYFDIQPTSNTDGSEIPF